MNKAKEILSGLIYDPNAKRSYDLMRGGFIWSDELPSRDNDYESYLKSIFLLANVIAYRASLTLGKPREKLKQSWDQLKQEVPDWPGFNIERITGINIRDLKAVKLKEEKCLNSLDEKME